jgi:hypothetical protein
MSSSLGWSLQLGRDDVLPRLTVPDNVEHIRLAANLTIFHVILASPYGSVHHRLVPLPTASALEARGLRNRHH